MIIYILLAWIVIGLASGLITDYVTEEDTRLKDLFAYSVFGPVTTVFGLLMIYNDKLKKKIDWHKVIIRNSKRTTNKVKILDKN